MGIFLSILHYMKLTNLGLLLAIVCFASCSSGNKKVLVLVNGGSTVDEASKTITSANGSGSETKELKFTGSDKTTLQLKADGKQTAIDIPTNGYYFLNATNDTVVGSYVTFSAPKSMNDTFGVIKQDVYKKSIDSLTELIAGKNISAANRNYFIPPHTAVKVTDNVDAIIVAPFHQMTTVEKEEGKEPEVYRFYTADEIRVKIEKQREFTKPKPAAGDAKDGGKKK